MDYKDYSFDLAARFRSDFGIPISIITNKDCFFYEVALYEKAYGSTTKYIKVVDMINSHFDGKVDTFLKGISEIRSRMITYLLEHPKLDNFLHNDVEYVDMKKINYPRPKYKSIYNEDAVGKFFLSIDMKKANFQCMKLKGIIEDSTYKDFLARFCDDPVILEYLSESKQFRQDVFGNCNTKNMPNRQTALQKYMMNKLYVERIKPKYDWEIAYMSADEIIFQIPSIENGIVQKIEECIADFCGLEFRVEAFILSGYNIFVKHSDGTRHKVCSFFHKSCDKPLIFKGLGSFYGKIVQKIMSDSEIVDMDKAFIHNDALAMYTDNFYLESIKS